MISFPNCKINIGLRVLKKRDDGFHDIETVFYPVPFSDVLEININGQKDSFVQSGINIPGEPADNLCLRAVELLRKQFTVGAINIHLHKIIPPGSGLGGGSSDAAFTLKMIYSLCGMDAGAEFLNATASRLGSDCSFFLNNKPSLGTGKGELLTEAGSLLKGYTLVLVIPSIQVSTAEAYKNVKPRIPEKSLLDLIKHPIIEWKGQIKNDFEEFVFIRHPEIADIKKKLYASGALYASMSGSGSAVYGIFEEPKNLTGLFPGIMVWSGLLA